jgi:UDP:flavonoid glycosyltransferase YjiC (YdhE family)
MLEFRRELGLKPGPHPLFEGAHSPRLSLGLFSRCLARPQRDWPRSAVITGFPFYRQPGALTPELERFLDEGPAPVVFTLGSSAVGAAGGFYRESLAAVGSRRAVLLTGAHPQGLPSPLPSNVIAVENAPHAAIFPRAAAIVHQGGIGTTAQAMASGRPMLVVPFAHDQFDNGVRVRRLGAAEVLYRSRYNARRAAAALERLLGEPSYELAAAKIAAQVNAENGAVTAADAIEAAL